VLKTSSKGTASRLQAALMMRGSSERLPLSSEDTALATRIFRESVIWKKYLDHVIGLYSRTQVKDLDLDVLTSLRIGAVQLLIMRIPSHAAVSATVEAHSARKTKGLVNAVLRKVASHREKPSLPMHIRYSHPEELVRRWLHLFGEEKTEQLLRWNNSAPELGGYAFSSLPSGSTGGRYLENYRIIERKGRFSPPSGFYVQDESSALVGRGMADLPGDPVLEIGAAPGGKTAHLAGDELVLSMDGKPRRMRRWLENSRRLEWVNCLPVAALSSLLPFSRKFGKVIADAPCSNTGVYRRRYDARWNWSVEMMKSLVRIQKDILRDASLAVAPGGILVYSTCSLEPEENAGVVDHFEETSSGFRRIPFPGPDGLVNASGFFSYFPPEAGIDGLFAAAWINEGRSCNEK